MPKLPAAVLVAFFVIAVHASPIDYRRILARQDELVHHYPVARQYMQSSYGGYDPTGGGGGYGGGYGSSSMGGYGVPGNGGFDPNTDPNASTAVQSLVGPKAALISASTQTAVATVGALVATGALPVVITGTKKAVNKTVQTVNSTYHHTKEKMHNVTTHILHPFRDNQEEKKKTDKDDHTKGKKDEVSRRDLIDVMARSFKHSPRTFYLQSSSSVDVDEQDSDSGKTRPHYERGDVFSSDSKIDSASSSQRHHWEITDSDWELGVSHDDSRFDIVPQLLE
ncbi:uncharacterized protein C8R40DRAFT_1166632 [Lentinula edodes]|uniref:uncharacterized protein n=1 Tax=Lentinula edodes TaxID=5353 RepID=UPI001E8E25A4|nr:uncharacterized protein C8R40DRAFT_1166632 [Lentinula edodes]KAH7879391.1 hypothetical protein C8R40DRAFT_1166632 [Lentinula edodes]